MAKSKSGLPEGFDIGVSAADLTGPVQLPNYLDDDPALELAKMMKKRAADVAASRSAPEKPKDERILPAATLQPAAPVPQPETSAQTAVPDPLPKPRRPRLQVNIGREGEQMVEELIDLVSQQSSVRRIKANELVQALVLNLYNARSEISLGVSPLRGRWGTPTAKSFPAALAQAFREAVVAHDKRIGGNQFKKAIGG